MRLSVRIARMLRALAQELKVTVAVGLELVDREAELLRGREWELRKVRTESTTGIHESVRTPF